MDHWTEIRRRVLTERLSKRRACEEYGIHWKTLEKMLEYPVLAANVYRQDTKQLLFEPFRISWSRRSSVTRLSGSMNG